MDDLEKSERTISLILAYMVPHGVRRVKFTVDDLSLGQDREDIDLFVDALVWLSSEGIIRYDSIFSSPIGVSDCVVTAYGYSLLGQILRIGGSEQSVGGAIKKVSEGKASYSNLGDFFGGLLGGFTKSLGS
jgi:hypothetical protein